MVNLKKIQDFMHSIRIEVEMIMRENVDLAVLGRAGILHHDFPTRYFQEKDFSPVKNPVTREYLLSEGVSKKFIAYLESWPGFVAK